MNPATAAFSLQKPNALMAILWGGTACGVLDITAAFIVYGYFGLRPIRLLQGIAAGLLGPRSLEGGLATAALGLLCHFVIAFGAATVYFAMNRIVVPLSAARKYPFSFKMMVIGVIIHMFCVGLPISLSVRRYSVH